ncbi:hypothetical protein VF21_08713 [Pseudogymnoascus sp. 05NY08]|nr:hypothetical protein VF21_08713 [Pseudogymnoascus sp. 05NY08]
MWGGATTRSQLRQSIDSLYTQYEVPESPTKNPINSKTASELIGDQSRRLNFSQEKDIASNLAFLSATSDDSCKIMAVCVEEHSNGEGITIRIASNSGDLSVVKAGFIKVGEILEQAARRRNSEIEDIETLLRQVVVLDMDRILSRLRSRHSKSKKQPFITQLHNAINDKTFKTTDNLTNGIGDLKDLFTRLEAIANIKAHIGLAHSLIRDILRQAYHLISPTNLSLLLKDLKIDPTLKTHLSNSLGKISGYYSAASFLVRAARNKKCRVFESIIIETFQIDVPPSLRKDHIKVHAEIQLLFFYELNPHLPRPRIICSSKSACYLCNLFFSLHGVFHIHRTHGRLYKKWILPDWLSIPPARRAELGVLATRLDGALKDRIQKGCIKHNHPDESVLSIPRPWTPSTISKASSLSSTSTVRPQPPLHRDGSLNGALSQLSSMPPTPPRTTPEHMPYISEVQSGAHTSCVGFPTAIHPLTITRAQLPYSQLITATTPPLLLHLNNPPLSLDFDFSLASPCRLIITQGDERAEEGGNYRTVDIEDIPTKEEMQVTRSQLGGKEVKFQLRDGDRGGVCVVVIWGGL